VSKGDERKYLRELTAAVSTHIDALDAEMLRPTANERGKRVAILCNALEMANDQARHFGLGEPLTKAKPDDPGPRCASG
jgi:hypothetical protein